MACCTSKRMSECHRQCKAYGDSRPAISDDLSCTVFVDMSRYGRVSIYSGQRARRVLIFSDQFVDCAQSAIVQDGLVVEVAMDTSDFGVLPCRKRAVRRSASWLSCCDRVLRRYYGASLRRGRSVGARSVCAAVVQLQALSSCLAGKQ